MKVKKSLLILLSSFVVISMCSCSGPKPSEVEKTFLEGIKKQDEKVVTDVYALGKLDILGASYKKATSKNEEGDKEDKDPKMDKLFNEQLLPKMLDFEYETSNEKIDGNKATVDVNIKTYRVGDTISSFFGEYMSQAFALAFLDVSEDRLDALAVSILSVKIADFKEKTFEKTVTLQMSKKDGKWIVNEIEEGGDFIDAISGDLASSFKNLESTFAAFEA